MPPTSAPSRSEAPTKSPSFAPSVHPSLVPSISPSAAPTAFAGTCESRRYVSLDDQFTDSWCQTKCLVDEEECYSSGNCGCADDKVGSSMSLSTVLALVVLSALF